MAEPETRTGMIHPDGRQPSDARGGVETPGEPTASFRPDSTPSLQRGDDSTDSEATERLVPVPEPNPRPDLPEIPGYQLLGVLGRGGMGTVYQAVHREMNRVVALKLIHAGNRDEAAIRVRFEREVQSLVRIEQHPNIVPVYGIGTWQGFPYLTMRFVPGGTLARHMERVRADLPAAIRLVAKVARAVHRLHEVGVLHRDLKPPNILLDSGDEPLVADFGLAKWLDDDSDVTASGAPLGTRQYMAPEQTLGSKAEYGPTCDVWGIGVILYEMLAGRRPYIADDPVELYQQIREHPPPPCAEFNPAVPPGVEAIARKCLEKDPAARYSTAEEVAEDLERWLGGEAITLPADTPQLTPRPARRYLRRRWLWVALAAVLLLTAGSVFALRPWERTPETTPPPPPPPERSIAERYRAGETVVLIGDTGMPLFPHTDVDDRHGFFAPGPEGCSAYSAVSLGMTELVSEDLPLPIRLELEVAMQPSQNGYGGFYLVRKAWPGPNGPHTSMVWVRMQSRSRLAVMHVQPIQEDAEIGVNWRGRRGSETISTPTSPIGAWNDGFLSPFPIPRPLRWHRVAVVITADEVQVTWDGKPFTPPNRRRPSANVGQADVLDHVKSMARGTWPGVPPDYLPPAFGPGIGVYAQQCVIAFRNVRLVPPVR